MKSKLLAHLILALAICGLMSSCGRSKPTEDVSADGGIGASSDAQVASELGDGGLLAEDSAPEVAPLVLPASCAADTGIPPKSLVCTGLYADIVGKVTAPGVVPYAPAFALWSDGAQKQRWIALPAGGVIDNTNPNEWVFPVGTKVWKEFSRGGQRVETRLWQKVRAGYWVDATYAWNADESAGAQAGGGDIVLNDGSAYHVPTQDECEKCHRGRTERILGFEQGLLGLPGATGLTLDALVRQGKLVAPPARTVLAIGDDGTGAAAPALGWLHVNCGVTCHNDNSNSTAYAAGMLLRLDPTELDGRPVDATFAAIRTTVGVVVGTPNWSGQTRIVAGSPEQSLIYQLISHRGMGLQMPPIATNLVDEVNDALVAAWIAAMPVAVAPPPPAPQDAGVPMVADGGGTAPDAGGVPGDAAADSGADAGFSQDALARDGSVDGATGGTSTGGVSGTGGEISGAGGSASGAGGVSGTGGEVSGSGGAAGTGGVSLGTGGDVSGGAGMTGTDGGTDAVGGGAGADATAGASGSDGGGQGGQGGQGGMSGNGEDGGSVQGNGGGAGSGG